MQSFRLHIKNERRSNSFFVVSQSFRRPLHFSDLTLGFYSWARKRQFKKSYPTFFKLLDPKKNDVVLDVGAGTGVITNQVANISDEVFALEPETSRVEYIKRKFPQVKAFYGVAESIPFPEGYFTKVYILVAYHHFKDQDGALYEIYRVLKRDGLLLIYEMPPAKENLEARLKDGLAFLSPEALKEKLETAGFNVVETTSEKKRYFVLSTKN
jgi:ubiquinone/menaquinone biosynthesis C-methylase UbiE